MAERNVDSLRSENRKLEIAIADISDDLGKMITVYEEMTGRTLGTDFHSISLEYEAGVDARNRAKRQNEVLRTLQTTMGVRRNTEMMKRAWEVERKRQEVEALKGSLGVLTEEVEKKERILSSFSKQK